MKENLNEENPVKNFCTPNTLINTGKKATVGANYSEDFRKKFQKVIQYPGKSWDLVRDVFDETIAGGGGVRFVVKYEKNCQIATRGPKIIIEEFLPVYNQKLFREVNEEVVTDIWPRGKVR